MNACQSGDRWSVLGLALLAALLLAGCEKSVETGVAQDPAALAARFDSATRTWSQAELAVLERGRQLYTGNCAACHLPSGEGQAVIGAPALKGSAMMTGPVAAHVRLVLEGRATMPGYADSLGDDALAAILSYERNAWGNAADELVTPAQVAAVRARGDNGR